MEQVKSTCQNQANLTCDVRDQMNTLQTNVRNDIKDVLEKVSKIEVNQNQIQAQVKAFGKVAEESKAMAMENRQMIENFAKQNKLDNVMEIQGVSEGDFAKYKDLNLLAINIFQTFAIIVDASDIGKVTVKSYSFKRSDGTEIKGKKLIVPFNDFELKKKVMRQKAQSKDHKNIYFNIALTPYNGYLWRKTRAIIKNKGLKCHFGDGLVRVKKLDGSLFSICGNNELEVLSNYVQNLPTSSQAPQ